MIYGKNFYEAVEVRQAAALCEDSAVRKHNLDTLDAEIGIPDRRRDPPRRVRKAL
jgi:hypothetical protein